VILPLPTQRMQTVLVQNVAVSERRRMPRRFPSQIWEGDEIRQTNQGVAFTFGAIAKQLGPEPPMIILPLPTQPMMTVVVACCAVRTRLEQKRHMPLQGYGSQLVRKTGSLNEYDKSVEFQSMRMLGPRPPQIILRLPSQQMMTIATNLVARAFRLTMPRRIPHYFVRAGIAEPRLTMPDRRLYVQVDLQAVATRIAAKLRQPHSKLLVIQVLAQPPPPVVTEMSVTLAGRTRGDAQRRAPHSRRIAPAVYNIPIFSTTVWLAARYRRGHWDLPPPTYISNVTMPQFVPVPIPPTPPFAPILVSTVAPRATRETYWRRYVEHAYFGPMVVSPAVPVQTSLETTLALRPRTDAQRRAPHYRLQAPTVVEPYLRVPDRRLVLQVDYQSVATRSSMVRRQPFSRIYPPATLEAASIQIAERTIRVSLVASRTRSETTRRTPHFHLTSPSTLEPWSVALQLRLIDTWLSGRTRIEMPRRAPHSHLSSPTVVTAAATLTQQQQTIIVTTVSVSTRRALPRRCRGNSRQGRPVVVFAPGPPLNPPTVQVTLAGTNRLTRGRRASHYALSPPATIAAPPQVFYGPVVTLAASRARLLSRRTVSRLAAPATLEPWSVALQERQIGVWAAGRTRIETVRRAPHSHLYQGIAEPPLQMPDRRLYVQVDLQAIWTRTTMARRRPTSRLSPPQTLQVFSGPEVAFPLGRTRSEAQRRAPHSHLSPPAVVAAPTTPSQQQQTLRVVTVAISTRRDLPRRCRGNSRQGRPVVVFAPGPPLVTETQVWLSGRTRVEAQRRAPHYSLEPPATLAAATTPPTLQQQTIHVTLATQSLIASLRHRQPLSGLGPPFVVNPIASLRAQVINVTLTAIGRTDRVRREPTSRLYPPAVQVYPPLDTTIAVTLAGRTRTETGRRAPHSRLSPPPVVERAIQAPDRRLSLLVVLAGRTRVELIRRAPHSRLRPGIVEPSLLPSDPRLVLRVDTQALWTRTSMVRRLPRSRLAGPAIGAVAPAAPVDTTLLVVLAGRTRVEAQRRAPHYLLSAPKVVEPALQLPDRRLTIQIDTQAIPTRQSMPRRAPHYDLSPPATLEPASVALRNRTIDTLLNAVPDRTSRLRRGPHSHLSPPATLEPESVELREQTITVVLAGRTRAEAVRRAPHYRLAPPAVVGRRLQPPDRQLTIPTPFAPAPKQPRRTHWSYPGPTPTPPVVTTIRLALSYRTRTETQRRASHYTLGEPTTLQVFSGPRVTLVSVRTRVEAVRRASRYRLAPPTKINPLATLAQQTLRVVTVAVRTRVEYRRHVVQHFLQPPTAILPKADIERQTIRTKFKIAVWGRLDRVRRIPHYILFQPTVVVPIALVNWRLSPDTNWIFEAAAANDWLADPAAGWEMEASANWLIEADPGSGWIIGNR
jgi:hypothetical protein